VTHANINGIMVLSMFGNMLSIFGTFYQGNHVQEKPNSKLIRD